jgi:ubiquinone biosynthesis protein
MERWMSEQVGPKAFLRRVKDTLPQMSEDLPEVPLLAHRVLRKAVDGELEIQWKSEQLEQIRHEIRTGNQRTQLSLAGATLTLGGILTASLLEASSDIDPLFLGGGLAGGGLLLLAWAVIR